MGMNDPGIGKNGRIFEDRDGCFFIRSIAMNSYHFPLQKYSIPLLSSIANRLEFKYNVAVKERNYYRLQL